MIITLRVGVGSGQHCHWVARRTDGALVLDARLQAGEVAVATRDGCVASIGQSQAQ